jgi:hypothetical protein
MNMGNLYTRKSFGINDYFNKSMINFHLFKIVGLQITVMHNYFMKYIEQT